MTEKNATNAIAIIPEVIQPGIRYEDAIWELIKEIWLFYADRNCTKARQILIDQFNDAASFDESSVPSLRQIQHRAKKDDWDGWGNDLIRSKVVRIDETHIARMLVLADKALEFADDLISGKYDKSSPGMMAVRWDAAKEMLRFRGLGTAGDKVQPKLEVTINQNADHGPDFSKMTTEEKAEFYRQNILQAKEYKRLTGHQVKS
jgi:hypothetical protein